MKIMLMSICLSLSLVAAACADTVLWNYKEQKKDAVDASLSHYNRGLYLETQKLFSEAMEEYKQSLLLNPEFAEARNNLGALLYDTGKIDEAIIEFRSALVLRPEFIAAQYNLATAYFSQKRFTDAAEAFRRVLAQKANLSDAQYFLAQCLNQLGEFNEAVRILDSLVSAEQDNTYVHYSLATNLFAAKRMERSLYHYRRVLEIDPNFPHAQEINEMISSIEKADIVQS